MLSPTDGLLSQIGQTQDVKLKGAIFGGNMIFPKAQNRDHSTNPGRCSLKEECRRGAGGEGPRAARFLKL